MILYCPRKLQTSISEQLMSLQSLISTYIEWLPDPIKGWNKIPVAGKLVMNCLRSHTWRGGDKSILQNKCLSWNSLLHLLFASFLEHLINPLLIHVYIVIFQQNICMLLESVSSISPLSLMYGGQLGIKMEAFRKQ
jgi:hypothetical protein